MRDPSHSLAGLTSGAAAVAEVNYDLRRKVAPNHTMTHVLNFALREVLGEGVVQKGSSVTHERLRYHLCRMCIVRGPLFTSFYTFCGCPCDSRFDFSLHRAIAKEELAQIEQRVNDVIRYASSHTQPTCLPASVFTFLVSPHIFCALGLQREARGAPRGPAAAAGDGYSRPEGGVRRGLP